MIKKKYRVGKLQILLGTTNLWGIELTISSFDWSVCLHLLNGYIIFEWHEDRELQP